MSKGWGGIEILLDFSDFYAQHKHNLWLLRELKWIDRAGLSLSLSFYRSVFYFFLSFAISSLLLLLLSPFSLTRTKRFLFMDFSFLFSSFVFDQFLLYALNGYFLFLLFFFYSSISFLVMFVLFEHLSIHVNTFIRNGKCLQNVLNISFCNIHTGTYIDIAPKLFRYNLKML